MPQIALQNCLNYLNPQEIARLYSIFQKWPNSTMKNCQIALQNCLKLIRSSRNSQRVFNFSKVAYFNNEKLPKIAIQNCLKLF